MAKKATIIGGVALAVIAATVIGGVSWLNSNLGPSPLAEPKYIHLDGPIGRKAVLATLKREGAIKSYDAFEIYAQWKRGPSTYRGGIFLFTPGMTPDQILEILKSPIKQMVRLPEGRWITWMGKILEEKRVCTEKSYSGLASKPDLFRKDFPWLPAGIQSLEGYLFPDTYDLPPTFGAKRTIELQLGAFQKRVKPEDLTSDQL